MEPSKYTGVILSAGKGSRIDPFNTQFPKPMLPIVNRPILEHQIEHLRALGMRDIIIVVGHLKEKIEQYFGDGARQGVRIRYVEQKQMLGIAHAVMQLEPYIHAPFMLFLGDIFYVPKDLGSMVRIYEGGEISGVLAVKRESDKAKIQKNFTVDVDERMRVSRVIEKPRYVLNDLKGCGMYFFGPEIFDAIRQTPRTALRDEYEITNAIQIFIDQGHWVRAAEVVDWDYNITYPADLLECNRLFLRQIGKQNDVATSAKVHSGCRLDGAVIGSDVVVDHPIRIANSVVLAGTHVRGNEDIEGCILSQELCIRCGPSQASTSPARS